MQPDTRTVEKKERKKEKTREKDCTVAYDYEVILNPIKQRHAVNMLNTNSHSFSFSWSL